MTTPLFSTYRLGENRVTATFLAVLQRLSLPNMDRILQTLLGDTDFSLVTFVNQPKGRSSTPDAKIGTGPALWIETKTTRNAVSNHQLNEHMKSLRRSESLLLLTPDDHAPSGIPGTVAWSNFSTLASAIEDILEDESEPPSEREAFLLREFILMLRQDGLLDSTAPKVMVVAARQAWPEYQRLGVYKCGPNKPMRPIQDSDHLAFYVDGQIQPWVPRIVSALESVDVTKPEEIESLAGPHRRLVEKLRESIARHDAVHQFGQTLKLLFLSGPEDDATVKLKGAIINDKKDKNGKTTPFTFGQPRYVTLESLRRASTTSELDIC